MIETDADSLRLFLNDPTRLVFVGSFLATFVALVLAQEQQTRVRNGVFGTAAGSTMGGLAGLFKNSPTLLVVGFVGSALGGAAGWFYHLLVSIFAGTRRGRRLLEYQVGGIESVRQRLILDEQELLLSALREWRQSFVRTIEEQKDAILGLRGVENLRRTAKFTITSWLVWFVESYGMIFDIAGKPKYRSRATLILFGRTAAGEVQGRHWLSYSGKLDLHRRTKEFPSESIGYKVLAEHLPSPYFTDSRQATKAGVSRAETTIRPFYTFRVTGATILALDWPEELEESDPYVELARDTFHTTICPAIADLVDAWKGEIQEEVGLRALN